MCETTRLCLHTLHCANGIQRRHHGLQRHFTSSACLEPQQQQGRFMTTMMMMTLRGGNGSGNGSRNGNGNGGGGGSSSSSSSSNNVSSNGRD